MASESVSRSKSKYKTKQKEILLDFLKEKSGEHVTAGLVCEHFKRLGAPIGQSTIYRHLESLVDEGFVNKYVIDANSPACFEYVGQGGTEICFHCKCEKCGKVIHLHCEELEMIREHLRGSHHFELNPLRTVLYGLCPDCVEG